MTADSALTSEIQFKFLHLTSMLKYSTFYNLTFNFHKKLIKVSTEIVFKNELLNRVFLYLTLTIANIYTWKQIRCVNNFTNKYNNYTLVTSEKQKWGFIFLLRIKIIFLIRFRAWIKRISDPNFFSVKQCGKLMKTKQAIFDRQFLEEKKT